ncbi:MAG: alpha-galactosidase, partial [Christensenellaceae bacterium]|nr:alpha-galactosidase [Christensenellaceae bacterium]
MSKFDTFKSGNLILKIAEVDASIVSPANNSKYVDTKCTFESGIFRLYLRPKRAIQVRHIAYEIDYAFEKDEAFFANGYQSWTDTREFKKGDKIHDLGLIGKTTSLGKIFVNAGDYSFARYNKRRSLYHGISYGYMRLGSRVCLLGSLYERNGYTIIYADMVRNKIIIEKDLSGVIIEDTKPYLLFEVFTKTGKYDEVFDAYFDAFNVKLRTTEKLKGYTSWYNYYSNISEEIVLRDLNGLASATSEINAFQIDDGYQTAVGDWLSVDAKKFPNGMKAIADAIHSKNIKAGIWLAPLAAESKSQI